MRTIVTQALTCMALSMTAALGGPIPEPIDLTSFGEMEAVTTSVLDDVPVHRVARRSEPTAPRFYVTGMLGDSFATLDDGLYGDLADSRINGSILTAGGAAGVAYARDGGQWRFEIEGRGRDDLTRTLSGGTPPFLSTDFHWAAADGWSAMANVWRDWWIGDRWAGYLGGGLGGGGYRYSLDGVLATDVFSIGVTANTQVAEFAWQVGGGVVYEVSERVAFDVGYRFFSIGQADATYVARIGDEGGPLGTLPQQFTAGEVLFSLRVYEPFRRWR